ncbi:MAG TPA: cell division protein FtsB [Nitrococcus sp.]|nr:cell division protein FtsB [Nitrococcus sp.]
MRWVIGLLALLLLALQLRLWRGDGSIQEVLQLRQAVAEQRQENTGLQHRNEALAADVRDLKQGMQAVEDRARRELGMIRRDETFYQIVSHDGR